MKMAPEGSSRGLTSGGKNFIERFASSFDEWSKGSKRKEVKDIEEDRVETESTKPVHEIIGFKNEIKSMKNFLLDQKVYKDFKSLVIVGEYGVGKTALCQTIFNEEDVKSVYAPRIWVSMHSKEIKEGENRKIYALKTILKSLGVEKSVLDTIQAEAKQEAKDNMESRETVTVEEREIAALLYALHLNLRWKKYLIVFDDVREQDNWNEKLDVKLSKDEKWGKYLSDGFPKGSGGRVIYTTREVTVAKKLVAEEHEIHRLWPLSDQQSVWKIYEAVVKEKEKEIPRNDKKCIDELMNKSRGLPLAARLIAELVPVFLDDETVPTTDVPTDPNNSQHATSPNPANNTSL